MNKVLVCLAWAFFSAAPWAVSAANTGQIINVNQAYQVAFTDLGNQALRPGDIVQVYITTDDFVYMQVLESSVILSKLGVSQSDPYKTNFKDLARITIGNAVAKVTEPAPVKASPPDVPKAVETSAPANDEEIQQLKTELGQARQKIKELMQQAQGKKDEEPESVPMQELRSHLENMNRIINQN